MRIGFIGLNSLGKAMSKNLLAAGHQLIVRDDNRFAAEELVRLGAEPGDTPSAIAQQVDVLITMLANPVKVKSVALGPNGIIEGCRPGLVYVDMSPVAPSVSRELARVLADKGVLMLDAPVSGGEAQAIEGTLSIMVGGRKAAFAEVREILGAMGSAVVHAGEVGAGNITERYFSQRAVRGSIAAKTFSAQRYSSRE